MAETYSSATSCVLCSYACGRKFDLLKHLFEAHSNASTFLLSCPVGECAQTFSQGAKFTSFVTHANRKHHNWRKQLESVQDMSECYCRPATPEPHGGDAYGEIAPGSADLLPGSSSSEDATFVCTSHPWPRTESTEKTAGHFLLSAKERHRLTQNAIKFTVTSVKKLIGDVHDDIKSAMVRKLTQQGIDTEKLDLEVEIPNPFEGLETEHMQTKFFQKNFGLVEPTTVSLGTRLSYNNKQRLVEKQDSFQYIPLIENLTSLLQNSEVYAEIIKPRVKRNGYLADVCDGTLYQEHPLFKEDPLALQLIIYYDEVEVVNPLGSYRGVHKLALFYYVLGNLQPKLRSKLQSIQLIAVVTSPVLKEYGFAAILEPFIHDANKLSQGVTINVGDGDIRVKGAVIMMLADTLGAHEIGGFKIGVGTAYRKCRMCMATKASMSIKFRDQDFLSRSPENYDYHCSLLDGCLADADSVTYGVNCRSPLNDLAHFHVANSQLPQDIMHILFEGVVPYELGLLLKEFICRQHYFSEDLLNERIDCFNYTSDEKRDKPTKINMATSLHQSAAQMWILAIHLPLLIGDKVPQGNDMWECFLTLLEIVQICTSRVIPDDVPEYLSALVQAHHRMFVRCFPTASFIPKLHYMVHFSKQIKKTGPLIASWCMRMEAKNAFFKRIAQIGNYKNVPLSVARRHQRLMCSYLAGDDFFGLKPETGPVKSVLPLSLECQENRDKILHTLPGCNNSSTVQRTKWIKVGGYRYHPPLFVVSGFQPNDLPQFSRIEEVLLVDEEPFFLLTEFQTIGIEHHFNSYAVDPFPYHTKKQVVHYKEIKEPRPINTHSLRESHYLFVALHSYVYQ